MGKLLFCALVIAVMLVSGSPAEARQDVYLYSQDNWDIYVDADSAEDVTPDTWTCIYRMVDRAESTPTITHRIYFSIYSKKALKYQIENGASGTCSYGDPYYTMAMFADKRRQH